MCTALESDSHTLAIVTAQFRPVYVYATHIKNVNLRRQCDVLQVLRMFAPISRLSPPPLAAAHALVSHGHWLWRHHDT